MAVEDEITNQKPDIDIAVITYNVIPKDNYMYKYERLGEMAIINRRLYCKQHSYDFIYEIDIPDDRPVCWAKIPAILEAMDNHDWVLWADSDTLIIERHRKLETFCNPKYDLIVQNLDKFYVVTWDRVNTLAFRRIFS